MRNFTNGILSAGIFLQYRSKFIRKGKIKLTILTDEKSRKIALQKSMAKEISTKEYKSCKNFIS